MMLKVDRTSESDRPGRSPIIKETGRINFFSFFKKRMTFFTVFKENFK